MVTSSNSFREVVEIFIDMQKVFETAIALFALFFLCTLFISTDVYAVYKQLLPFEGLWQSLDVIDRARLIMLPLFFALTIWYFFGAFFNRPAK